MSKLSLLLFSLLFLNAFAINDYIITNISYNKDRTALAADLTYTSQKPFDISSYKIEPLQNATSIKLIKELKLIVELQCDSILHYVITDKNTNRFQANLTDSKYNDEKDKCTHNLNLNDIGFVISKENTPFSFELRYQSQAYYTLSKRNLLFSDTLIVFDASLTSDMLFGFGERNTNFKLNEGRYTIWPNDTTHTYRDKLEGGYNLMGEQPIGLHKAKNGLFLGLIFMNVNPQDFVIKHTNDNPNFNTNLEHRTIGGIIDYYLTIANTADDAILNIHRVIGRPAMPPLWALGWNHCKWGYKSTEEVKMVYKKYKEYNLPVDTFWIDIDMLYKLRNFIVSNGFNKTLPDFIKELHKDNRKFIPIVDYGIPANITDPYYKLGNSTNAFLKSNYTKTSLVNHVWPGKSVFPDVFSANGKSLWNKGLSDFDKKLNFDGIWLDMNEPGMTEIIKGGRGEYATSYNPSNNKYEYLPYIPGYRVGHSDLQTKGISLNGYSTINDPNNDFYTMINIKAMISLYQVRITNQYLISTGRRPFILSRSNTIGHGKYAFHWLGDNASTFEDLKASIAGIFNYNIYGIPMTGADICGFHNKATDQLCARWHVLGAFYPFSRNHNEIYMTAQEPWSFSTNLTLKAATVAIRMKYSLIRYFYTQLMMISIGKKGAFFKPLFFEFPNDDNVYTTDIMDIYVMVGDGLMLIPNTNQNDHPYKGYFPNSNWNMFPSGNVSVSYNSTKGNEGTLVDLNGAYAQINVFIKGGSIIPHQIIDEKISTTNDLYSLPIELMINPNENNIAEGDVVYDNGEIDVITNRLYAHVKINYSYSTIYFTIENMISYAKEDQYIERIVFYRGKDMLKLLGDKVDECEVLFRNGIIEMFNVEYDSNTDQLKIIFTNKKVSIFDIKIVNL